MNIHYFYYYFYCPSWVWQRYGNTMLNQWSTLSMNLSSCYSWIETERMTYKLLWWVSFAECLHSSYRSGKEFRQPEGVRRRVAAHSCWKKVEVVQRLIRIPLGAFIWGFVGINSLGRLCSSNPLDPEQELENTAGRRTPGPAYSPQPRPRSRWAAENRWMNEFPKKWWDFLFFFYWVSPQSVESAAPLTSWQMQAAWPVNRSEAGLTTRMMKMMRLMA